MPGLLFLNAHLQSKGGSSFRVTTSIYIPWQYIRVIILIRSVV